MARKRPAAKVAEGSRRIEAALLEQRQALAVEAAQVALGGEAPVHRSRVAARRLRSLLKTFRPSMDERAVRRLRTQLRGFAHALSPVREADVQRELLLDLVGREPGMDPAELRRLSRRLAQRRRSARAALAPSPPASGRRSTPASRAAWPALGPLRLRPEVTLAGMLEQVDATWKPILRRLRREPTGIEELHELRLSLKHGRYALEPIADLEPAAARRLLRRLRAAQDRIGEHRDTLLARDWVVANVDPLGEPLALRLVQLLGRHERRLRRQAVDRVRRVLPAYREWRKATRPLRREAPRGRSSPAPRRRSSAPSAR